MYLFRDLARQSPPKLQLRAGAQSRIQILSAAPCLDAIEAVNTSNSVQNLRPLPEQSHDTCAQEQAGDHEG